MCCSYFTTRNKTVIGKKGVCLTHWGKGFDYKASETKRFSTKKYPRRWAHDAVLMVLRWDPTAHSEAPGTSPTSAFDDPASCVCTPWKTADNGASTWETRTEFCGPSFGLTRAQKLWASGSESADRRVPFLLSLCLPNKEN